MGVAEGIVADEVADAVEVSPLLRLRAAICTASTIMRLTAVMVSMGDPEVEVEVLG